MRISLWTAACLLQIGLTSPLQAQDLPRVFVTSSTGSGNLNTWPLADGLTGLQAADRICQNSASLAHIANPWQYIAWISSSQDDAYCRVHGLHGKRVNSCNTSQTLGDAGPWYRMDDLPAIDIAQNSMVLYPDAGYVPRAIEFDEFGFPFLPDNPLSSIYFTATIENGVLENPTYTCADWTSADPTNEVEFGEAYLAYGGWSGDAGGWTCDQNMHLACLEAGSHGPALPRGPARFGRMAFVTSSTGTGDLSSWPDSGGATSVAAGDAICRAHARRAHLPLPDTYKAWLSSSAGNAISAFTYDGPWYRTDGAQIAASIADLTKGTIEVPLQLDESANPMDFQLVFTGTSRFGTLGRASCSDWQNGTNSDVGTDGWLIAADSRWTSLDGSDEAACGQPANLYCFADNDALFVDGFDN